jgi:2,3-bisphosphoglycerate-independent phosphoglycerate mutase
MKIMPGDVAFRGNWATLDDEGMIVDRRAGRIREGTKELSSSLCGL